MDQSPAAGASSHPAAQDSPSVPRMASSEQRLEQLEVLRQRGGIPAGTLRGLRFMALGFKNIAGSLARRDHVDPGTLRGVRHLSSCSAHSAPLLLPRATMAKYKAALWHY